ncbi:MAG: HAMP domain-containing sensor histidine kinase [Planctomycetota bacterium]
MIVVTSSGNEDIAARVFRLGAADYIRKDTAFGDEANFRRALLESLRRYDLEHTTRELTRRLKQANNDLTTKGERLAAMSETAHRFVEDVAHEFRTPLAVIQEFASIMGDGIGGEISPKHGEFLGFIVDATRDLTQLVDDFLDGGKLRAGTLRVARQPIGVDALLDSAWPMLESRARGITLERHLAADVRDAFGDPDKARRTLINLVINAIKFSGAGTEVAVSVRRDGDDAIRIAVEDQGPGMTEEQQTQLFERFRQADAMETFGSKGFGLGLSIVKELVDINLGAVDVRSRLGEGSTFSFTLPTPQPRSVLGHYLRWLAREQRHEQVAALRVQRDEPAGDRDALFAFLATESRAHDLQLPDPAGDGVILLGPAQDPAGWRTRLLALDRARPQAGPGQPPGAMRCEHLGRWDLASAEPPLLAIVTRTQEAVHA